MSEIAILKAFSDLPDVCRGQGRRHSIPLCLAIFTLAVVEGNQRYTTVYSSSNLAYELEKLGHQVEIFEGSPRFGGRIWTHRFGDASDAPYGEMGAMRISKEHQHTLHYIHEMGLGDKLST